MVNELLETIVEAQAWNASTWRVGKEDSGAGAQRLTPAWGAWGPKNAWGKETGFREEVTSPLGLGGGIRVLPVSKIVKDFLGKEPWTRKLAAIRDLIVWR